jgi:hypothetical protein
VFKTIYSLGEYDRFTGFDAVVRLKPASDDATKQAKHELSKELSKQTAKHDDVLSKISKKEKEREEREKKDAGCLAEDFSRENEKNAKLLSSKAQHNESECLARAKPCLAYLDSDSSERGVTSEFTGEEAALLSRICDRMRQQSPGKPISAFELAVGMKVNDHDIGIERCKVWVASEAGA